MTTFVNNGWHTVVRANKELPNYRRLMIRDGDWSGIAMIIPDTWAYNQGFVSVDLYDRMRSQHVITAAGGDRVRPNKHWIIRSLDEDEIERQLREKLRVLSMRRPVAKVRV